MKLTILKLIKIKNKNYMKFNNDLKYNLNIKIKINKNLKEYGKNNKDWTKNFSTKNQNQFWRTPEKNAIILAAGIIFIKKKVLDKE